MLAYADLKQVQLGLSFALSIHFINYSTFLMHVQHEQIQNIVIVMRGDIDRPLIMYEVQCIVFVCLLRSSNKKIKKNIRKPLLCFNVNP